MQHARGRLAMPHNLYPKALSLARPVARGWLSLTHAHTSLMADAFKAERDGDLDGCQPLDVWRIGCHLLSQQLERELVRRDVAAAKVRRRLRPLIALRRPRNVLLAEAHDVNGADGFPFTEEEITDLTREAVWFALPTRERAHG